VVAYQADEKNRGFMMSIFSTFGAMGYAAAPGIVAFFIVRWGLPSLLLLILPLPWLVYMLNKVPITRVQRGEEGKPVLSSILSAAMIVLIVILILRAWGSLAYSTYLVFILQERGIAYDLAAAILKLFWSPVRPVG
jgi:hypothetical protein